MLYKNIYRKQKTAEGFYVYLHFFYKAYICTNVMKQLNMKKYNIQKHTNTVMYNKPTALL